MHLYTTTVFIHVPNPLHQSNCVNVCLCVCVCVCVCSFLCGFLLLCECSTGSGSGLGSGNRLWHSYRVIVAPSHCHMFTFFFFDLKTRDIHYDRGASPFSASFMWMSIESISLIYFCLVCLSVKKKTQIRFYPFSLCVFATRQLKMQTCWWFMQNLVFVHFNFIEIFFFSSHHIQKIRNWANGWNGTHSNRINQFFIVFVFSYFVCHFVCRFMKFIFCTHYAHWSCSIRNRNRKRIHIFQADFIYMCLSNLFCVLRCVLHIHSIHFTNLSFDKKKNPKIIKVRPNERWDTQKSSFIFLFVYNFENLVFLFGLAVWFKFVYLLCPFFF